MLVDYLLPNLAFITNIRGSQLFIILLVILLLFGTKKLPEVARGIGKAIREFRKSASEVEQDFRQAINEEPPVKEGKAAAASEKES